MMTHSTQSYLPIPLQAAKMCSRGAGENFDTRWFSSMPDYVQFLMIYAGNNFSWELLSGESCEEDSPDPKWKYSQAP